jgi:hypothetical protein
MNVLTIFSAMAPFIIDRSLYELFPAHFMKNLPYDRVRPYCCILCGKPMAQNEMFPPNRITPRAICSECWAALTASVNESCWICNDNLENWKIDRQYMQPRDLHFRLHGGKCRDYFSLVSAKALGQNTGIRVETHTFRPSQPSPETGALQHTNNDLQIEMSDSYFENFNTLPGSQTTIAVLPPPTDLLKLKNCLRINPDPASTMPMHKGKNVKVIPLHSRRQRE